MSHRNTVLSQFLKLVPKYEFLKLAKEHHNGQKFRKFTRFDQFIVLFTLQVTGRNSIRDVIENVKSQVSKLFHIGTQAMSRSSLSRINNDQPWELYQALFYKILARCQPISGSTRFVFTINFIQWTHLPLIFA